MVQNINKKAPSECTSINEVRSEIDSIDYEIIRLLGVRFGYVREVVKYKKSTDEGIEASDRRKAVIKTRSDWATKAGLNPDVIGNLYDQLVEYFIDEEKKIVCN